MPLFVAPTIVPRKADYRVAGPLRLLMAGRLIKRKRFDVAVAALSLLRARNIDSLCTIYGAGPYAAAIADQAAKLGVGEKLRFQGFTEEWWRNAASHDIFLQVSEEEGFCIVAAEAMMVGLPVVATPVGGLRDYSRHGKTAIHVPIGDPEALADAIVLLFNDESRRTLLGSAASRCIQSAYSPDAANLAYSAINTRLFATG